MSTILWILIGILVIAPVVLSLIITLICYGGLKFTGGLLIPLLAIVLFMFFYVLIFNIVEQHLDQSLFIDPNMQVFDYIWYTLFTILVVFLSAALIHSITISSGLMAYMMMVSLGIAMTLVVYTIFYRVYKHRENLKKIVFIMTVYAILLTFLILFLNKFVPINILKILYVLYSCFMFGYVCCLVVMISKFIYDLIVHPRRMQNISNKFNVFKRLNAGAFSILSL